MKKLTKLLISLCLILILPFTFTACKDNDGSNNTNKADVSSATAYANWLKDNYDKTQSYVVAIGYGEEVVDVKYKYNASTQTQMYAYYVEDSMVFYYEVKQVDAKYKISAYDIESKKYVEDTLTKQEYYSQSFTGFANEITDNSDVVYGGINRMKIYLSFRHYFGDMTANLYLNFFSNFDEQPTNTTKEIEKVYEGKYAIKETAYEGTEVVYSTKFVYNNNLIEEIVVENAEESYNIAYEYKTVDFSINKSQFSTYPNMSSAKAYANWLKDNQDITIPYTATMSMASDSEEIVIKYNYDETTSTQKYALYQDSEMVFYCEIEKDGLNYKVTGYSVSKKQYIVDNMESERFNSLDSNFGKYVWEELENWQNSQPDDESAVVISPALKIEMQAGFIYSKTYSVANMPNFFLNFNEWIENSEISDAEIEGSINKLEEGRCQIKQTATKQNETVADLNIIYNNHVIERTTMNFGNEVMTIVYDYTSPVNISFDKTQYTQYVVGE